MNESVSDESKKRGGETILLVEDQQDVGDMAEEMLETLGYKVLRAPDAARAVDIIDSDQHVDLLFTDIVMPGSLNGADLARRAQRHSGLKAVLVTGYADRAISLEQFDEFDVLLKPYRMDELEEHIRTALDS